MNIDWANFVLKVDEVTLIAPCLKFVLYLDNTDDAGILDFYERSINALGNFITHYKAENMKRRARFDARASTMVPTWFKRPRSGKTYFMQLSGCDENQGISSALIELSVDRRPLQKLTPEQVVSRKNNWKILYEQQGCKFSPSASALRVTLPLEHELAIPSKFLSWVLDFKLAKEWPFLSGHSGYALNHYEAIGSSIIREQMQKQLGSLCLRYPGLDWHNIGGVEAHLLRYEPEWMDKTGYFLPLIKRLNWLTLICSGTIDSLGGQSKLQETLGADLPIHLHMLKHGLAIQAGNMPKLGDIAHRDFLPAYRRVAKVLRPVRLEAIPGLGRGFSDAAANEWLNAFDKDYD